MNIDDLTIGELKQLQALIGGRDNLTQSHPMIGKKVIIRTYSAGVHFGELAQKSGTEVILKNSRRLWLWKAAKSISLSAVANYGLNCDGSKITPVVEEIWLDAIEIIPCSKEAIESIEGAKDAKAQ